MHQNSWRNDKEKSVLPAEESVMGVWKQCRSTGECRHSDTGWWELLAVLCQSPLANKQGEKARQNIAGNWGKELRKKTGWGWGWGVRKEGEKKKKKKRIVGLQIGKSKILQTSSLLQSLCFWLEAAAVNSVLFLYARFIFLTSFLTYKFRSLSESLCIKMQVSTNYIFISFFDLDLV